MRTAAAALALTLALTTAASALRREWGPWKTEGNIGASFWPKGADALVNRKERIGGFMVNAFDHLRYEGDTKALNAFLADLGKVQGPRSVYLVGPNQQAGFIHPRVEESDWTMSLSGNGHTGVFLPADGPFRLSDLKIPAEAEVACVGRVGADARRRAAEHQKRRSAPPSAIQLSGEHPSPNQEAGGRAPAPLGR
jgi:hypothetical protein